ncbi:amylo-alpha-1,6-glucosidase [Listeria costaricensis]|uniref:amylo-alpha-1,6-glucosidase n=1 Tax=Listeria costaricensis TaxID=2026604 RepID=UPI0019699CA0|nr:glycoside hydrolase 100 family protein [Listeria costaricensis]
MVVAEAKKQAKEKLFANGKELGLVGSNTAYQQVWARDSMISGLGLIVCGEERGLQIHRQSLETLRKYQSKLGKIPHNVGLPGIIDPALLAHGMKMHSEGKADEAVVDSIHAGCIDSNLWYIIGQYGYFQATADLDHLAAVWESLKQALRWLEYQDSNECGLLEVHEAMDWADLFANRYNVLLDNVLYYAAWKIMGQLAQSLGFEALDYFQKSEDVYRKINVLLWVGQEEPNDYEEIGSLCREWLYPLKRVETELVERPFYLPYMGFREYADRFDTLANLLAILFGVADQKKAEKILDYIHGCGLNRPYPVQSVYPVIQPGDKDWREYYRVRNLNQPHHYHNGGAWPFIGGFYVAALVKVGRLAEAEQEFQRLTEMNRGGQKNDWEFNEWFHGTTGQPMGFAGQSWSAAMYLFAEKAVSSSEVPIFNQQNDW